MQVARSLLNAIASQVQLPVPIPPYGESQQAPSVAELRRQPLVETQAPSSAISADSRAIRFKQELLAETVDLTTVKRLSFDGIPDKDGLRAIAWKLLLGYIPPESSRWEEALKRQRTQYQHFCEELIIDPKKDSKNEQEATPELQPKDVTNEDHPLCLDHSSKWNVYFKDNEVMEQIVRDVMRTHPDMHFFSSDTPEAELHRQELERALFLYAKLNPGLRYIQGMNELLAPLYYLFKTDVDRAQTPYAEADAFWCFMELISEFRDHFCMQLDNSSSGIKATIRRLMMVLRHHDQELWHHLEIENKVDGQFYAFRWITLLLSQEFKFPEVLRIWDMILSDPRGKMDCLLRICTALILHIRERLMGGDFTVCLKTLQRYPPVDINIILRLAASLPTCSSVLGPDNLL